MAAVMAYDAYTRSHFQHAHPHAQHNTHQPFPAPDPKHHGGPVYYRQHEVIQLVEVAPPPPAQHPSTITTSSLPSSSAYTGSCESESDESECSSYCSSDDEDSSPAYYDDTYATRVTRVLAWRDSLSKALAAVSPGASISALRVGTVLTSLPLPQRSPRHITHNTHTTGSSTRQTRTRLVRPAHTLPPQTLIRAQMSHLSRRSRPEPQPLHKRLGPHSCSACDAEFPSRQGLSEHVRASRTSEACQVALAYRFES